MTAGRDRPSAPGAAPAGGPAPGAAPAGGPDWPPAPGAAPAGGPDRPAPGATPAGAREAVPGILGWVVALVAVLAVLHSPAARSLAPPPVTSGVSALSRWMETRDAATALFAVVRLVVVVVAWYLLGTLLVGLALALGRAGRAAAAVELVTLPPIRRLVRGAAGLTLAASAVTLAGGADGPDGRSGAAASAPAGAGPGAPAMRRVAGPGDVVMERVADEDDVVMRRADGEPEGAVMRELPAEAGPAAAEQWTVEPGDHLWLVAEKVLAASWARRPTDAETTPYWVRLVEANRARMADPDNPDLLYPGQVLELPPAPPAPGA